MKKLSIKNLRNIILETIQEEKVRQRNKFLKNTAKALLESAIDEEASAGNMNPEVMKNVQLSAVDVDKAKEIVTSGEGDPDIVNVGASEWDAQSLYPTQSTMNLNKAVHFALGMMNGTMYKSGGPGGNLGAFVATGSGQPYLLDGHHRWLATCMVDPSASCAGFDLQFPARESVAILNTMTGGLMGHNVGKSGTGDFAQFYDKEKVLSALKSATSVPQDGIEPLKVLEAWTEKEGDEAYEAAVDKFIKNLETCPGAQDSSVLLSQGREDMPVADDAEHAGEVGGAPVGGDATQNVIDTLNTGKMDVNSSGDAEPEEDEDKKMEESVAIRRWNKLAGILKD